YAHRASDLRGAVVASVGDNDDVELAGLGRGEQAPQVGPEDAFLVVRGDHDARHRMCAHRSAFRSPGLPGVPGFPGRFGAGASMTIAAREGRRTQERESEW